MYIWNPLFIYLLRQNVGYLIIASKNAIPFFRRNVTFISSYVNIFMTVSVQGFFAYHWLSTKHVLHNHFSWEWHIMTYRYFFCFGLLNEPVTVKIGNSYYDWKMPKGKISYIQNDEPEFIKRFKQKVGYKEGPTVDTKVSVSNG